jgi:hypothetical protein
MTSRREESGSHAVSKIPQPHFAIKRQTDAFEAWADYGRQNVIVVVDNEDDRREMRSWAET